MPDATTRNLTRVAPAIRRNATALVRALPKAAGGDERAVHRARVATRRLREALPVAGGSAAVTRDVRRLTRALGPVREMDVCRALIRELAAGQHWPARLVNRLDDACARQRDHARRRLTDVIDRLDRSRLEKELDGLAAKDSRPREEHARRAAVNARLLKRTNELETALADAGTLYVPEKLHAVRKAAKKLRYAVEMSSPTVSRAATGLRSLQQEFGTLHDLQMVQRRLQELAATSRDAWLVRVASGLDRDLERRCRELHGVVVGRVPSLLRLIDRLKRASLTVRPRPARAGGRLLQFPRSA